MLGIEEYERGEYIEIVSEADLDKYFEDLSKRVDHKINN